MNSRGTPPVLSASLLRFWWLGVWVLFAPRAAPGQDPEPSAGRREFSFNRNAELEEFRVIAGTWKISAGGLTCSTKGTADEIQLREGLFGIVEVSLTVATARVCELRFSGGTRLWRIAVAKARGEAVLYEGDVERARVELEPAKGRKPLTVVAKVSPTGFAVRDRDGGWNGATVEGDPANADQAFQLSLVSVRSQSTFQRLTLTATRVEADPTAGQPEEAEVQDADALLVRAEQHARRGRYGAAVSAYRALAREHPDTEAGLVGVRRSRPSAFLGWADVVRSGSSGNRVDVVLMGEGYTLAHQDAFVNLAGDVPPLFEKQPTFREYYPYLNFLRAVLVSQDAGVDEYNREYDTALGGRRTGSIQGHVAVDRTAVMRMLDEMPAHDRLAVVFVRRGQLGTGGAGVATIGGRNNDTVIHEFGHAFAGLGDEYTQETSHRGATATRPNVSSTDDPTLVPWRHWLKARVRGVGVYQGADGKVKGAWKPTTRSCVMDNGKFFCVVCREALVLAVYRHVDPIERCEPDAMARAAPDSLPVMEDLEFKVEVMVPASHGLEVAWYVLPEQLAPPGVPGWENGSPGADRRARGPLASIDAEPVAIQRHKRQRHHQLTVRAGDLAPGRFRVVCRVRDDTRLRGDPEPWVMGDPAGLLESERAWWVEVPAR